MLAIPSRHRSLTLLGIVLVAQMLLLAMQIKREQQVRLIRVWAVEAGRAAGPRRRVDRRRRGRHLEQLHRPAPLRARKMKQLQAELDRLKCATPNCEGRAAEADRLSRPARISRRPRRSAHAGRARDRRESGCRQPHHLSQPRLARRHAARHGRDHAGRRGRQDYGGLSGHFARCCCSATRRAASARCWRIHARKARCVGTAIRFWHGVRQQRREGSDRAKPCSPPARTASFRRTCRSARSSQHEARPPQSISDHLRSSPRRTSINWKRCWCCSPAGVCAGEGRGFDAHADPPSATLSASKASAHAASASHRVKAGAQARGRESSWRSPVIALPARMFMLQHYVSAGMVA